MSQQQQPQGYLKYARMAIEAESPEEHGYENIACNLAESSISDAILGKMFNEQELSEMFSNMVMLYGDHKGHPQLRKLIVQDFAPLQPSHVILTTGAALALFIIATSLLNKEDRLLVVHPNYGTNIETPAKSIGCKTTFINLTFEEQWQLDINLVKQYLQDFPDTKMVSITNPHNPTGVTIKPQTLYDLIAIIKEHNAKHNKTVYLLVDETYREMNRDEQVAPLAASLGDFIISVSSMSKTYGLPGIRLGWLVCQNEQLLYTFLAAKEQIIICGSTADEEIGYRAYVKRAQMLETTIKPMIAHNLQIMTQFFANHQDEIEWVVPNAGVVSFARLKGLDAKQVEHFYKILLDKYKTFVGCGHWFGFDDKYMRIGYGWPKSSELQQGLQNILLARKEALEM